MDQKEKIRQLYESGTLTKEEMEAELKKISVPQNAKSNKLRLAICTVILIIFGIFIIIALNKSDKPADTHTVSNTPLAEATECVADEPFIEIPQWEVTDIKGSPAIQTQFYNLREYLQIAYGPTKGFRFCFLDENLSPKPTSGKLVGYKEKGEDYPTLLTFPKREDNYLYYDAPNFFDILNSGDVEYLTIEQVNDDGSKDESVDCRWYVKFKPGEISEMTRGLR